MCRPSQATKMKAFSSLSHSHLFVVCSNESFVEILIDDVIRTIANNAKGNADDADDELN